MKYSIMINWQSHVTDATICRMCNMHIYIYLALYTSAITMFIDRLYIIYNMQYIPAAEMARDHAHTYITSLSSGLYQLNRMLHL